MKQQYIFPSKSIKFLPNRNFLLVEGVYGFAIIILPKKYFYFSDQKKIIFSFNEKSIYLTVLAHLKYLLARVNKVYLLKLRLRGLGYRFRRFCSQLYRFYFTKTNYIHLHVPKEVILRKRKRRFIMISNNYDRLRELFVNILLLKSSGPYNKRGFVYPRRILFLKPGKRVT